MVESHAIHSLVFVKGTGFKTMHKFSVMLETFILCFICNSLEDWNWRIYEKSAVYCVGLN